MCVRSPTFLFGGFRKLLLMENQTPVLIIRGVCDYKPASVAAQYDTVFPNSTYVELSNAGHMVYWEQPEEFLSAVRSFLAAN